VFVVDDDRAMRDSVRSLMFSVGFAVEVYESAGDFLDRYDRRRPGCVVLDVRMPGMSGLELQDRLVAEGIEVPIIMVSGYGDVPMAVRALKGGAIDFIVKPYTDQELLDRVNLAIACDDRRRVAAAMRADVEARVQRLTRRETQVIELVVEGKANKVIADELGLSHKTIEVHRARAMEKLRVGSLAELLQLVLGHRLRGAAPPGGPVS
jgi:two-component system response regulator FixJ